MRKTIYINKGTGQRSNINIPDNLRMESQRRADKAGFVNYSEYIRYLIMKDLQENVERSV